MILKYQREKRWGGGGALIIISALEARQARKEKKPQS